MVEFSDAFPPIQVDRVPFARFEHSVDRTSTKRINVVSMVGQRMGVPTLHETTLFLTSLVHRVVHEDLTRNVGEGAVQAASNENAAIVKAYGA